MDSHQKLANKRQERRFSVGDGVCFPDGCEGVIRGHHGEDKYLVEVAGEADWRTGTEAELVSTPKLNTGKYGGPARGGAAEGYAGGNSYRRLR